MGAATVSPDQTRYVTVESGKLVMHDGVTGSARTLPTPDLVTVIAWRPEGILAGTQRGVVFVDPASGAAKQVDTHGWNLTGFFEYGGGALWGTRGLSETDTAPRLLRFDLQTGVISSWYRFSQDAAGSGGGSFVGFDGAGHPVITDESPGAPMKLVLVQSPGSAVTLFTSRTLPAMRPNQAGGDPRHSWLTMMDGSLWQFSSNGMTRVTGPAGIYVIAGQCS